MNIGQMVRGLLGDVKPGEAKQLELKPGQVVRGVVTEVSEDGQEAVMNINGTQVKAKLESPLAPGQTTMLQVQPETENGLVVLKPLQSSPGVPIAEQSLGDVLKSVGLPDQKWARELIQLMQQNGVPITKETAEQMRTVMAQLPQGVSQEDWMQASALAFKRGLPLTQETVKALHQVLFGKPLTQLLATLQLQLADALEPQPAAPQPQRGASPAPPAGGGAHAQAPASLGGARAGAAPLLLTQAAAVLQELAAAAQPAAKAQGAAGTAAAPAPAQAAPGANAPSAAAQGLGAPASQGAPGGAAASEAAAAMRAPAAPADPGAARTAPTAAQSVAQPQPASQQGMSSALSAIQQRAEASTLPTAPQVAASHEPSKAASILANASSHSAPTEADVPPQKAAQDPWIGRVLKLLGVEHEQMTWKSFERTTTSQGPSALAQEPALPINHANTGSGMQALDMKLGKLAAELPLHVMQLQQPSGGAQALPENLKLVLLQFIQSEDVPPTIKDTAQQLINQITGQQLMLSQDRSAPFAYVSLFVPLKNSDGEETAAVHIQTRKGKRGELDAGNCHLWFDLNLRALGRTIADVNVVDHIVSLKLLNDQEWLGSMIQERRSEMEAALTQIGYQLISLQTGPVPVKQDSSHSAAALGDHPAAAYTPSAYKGVDLLI